LYVPYRTERLPERPWSSAKTSINTDSSDKPYNWGKVTEGVPTAESDMLASAMAVGV
jgi:hypothetical protein